MVALPPLIDHLWKQPHRHPKYDLVIWVSLSLMMSAKINHHTMKKELWRGWWTPVILQENLYKFEAGLIHIVSSLAWAT